MNAIIKFFLENKLVTMILLFGLIGWGISTAPFDWDTDFIPRNPVPIDAIPDIGENQQIIYTEWSGRSPQDIEDQISYPLTTALLGIPGIKTIRSNSIFGLSTIYLIFEDGVEFYWSRTRILEKLNSLPSGTLPDKTAPSLGPDATALGQVYWYTLEGRDQKGNPTGGWDAQELRSLQDFYLKYALTSVKGVSEVASIGGFVKEYQVDIDPMAMKAYGLDVSQIMEAIQKSNLDIGARTIEYNRVEYLIRGLGYIHSINDLEESVVISNDNVPIKIKDIAKVNMGPATRRGGLDKGGSEAVGAVVVARYGANPLQVITNLKEKINEIKDGLPVKMLSDGTVSQVTIVPFYDRTKLIKETLGTLQEALTLEILIAIIVVVVLVLNLRASLLISSLLPIGVLMTFAAMRTFNVDANIVALSGIAIAIGVMVDVGVVFTENIIQHLELPHNQGLKGKKLLKVIYQAVSEVASAVITALTTTIISFLPIFAMQAAEGKLFKPLAMTKTFSMLAALVIGLIFIPTFAHIIFSIKLKKSKASDFLNVILSISGLVFSLIYGYNFAIILVLFGINNLLVVRLSKLHKIFRNPIQIPNSKYTFKFNFDKINNYINIGIALLTVLYFLAVEWMPLGAQNSFFTNYIFVVSTIGTILAALMAIVHFYAPILAWCLGNKWTFLSIPLLIIYFGAISWLGFENVMGFVANNSEKAGLNLRETSFWKTIDKNFSGIAKEFMPALDEGSFLLMPTTMPHAGVEENIDVIAKLDKKVGQIPEVDLVVGKWGRVNSALDPAPVSMYENIINYKSEYVVNEDGYKIKFQTDKSGKYILNYELQQEQTLKFDKKNNKFYIQQDKKEVFADEILTLEQMKYLQVNILKYLVEDKGGNYFRQWREHINSPDDIWKEILKYSKIPGLTSAPKLQPIQTRLIMQQTGMRSPMGLKLFGSSLDSLEKAGYILENILKNVPSVDPNSVFADRVVGKAYLEIKINRKAIARYGLSIFDMQKVLSVAIGGKQLSTAVEGRERLGVRVRYARQYRDNPDDLKRILIPTPSGAQIQLDQLADITYTRGAQLIKSEDTFLVSYVIFDKKSGFSEIDVVEDAQELFAQMKTDGNFILPQGITYRFTGNYENQVRANKRLLLVIPISLLLIFLILYFQFRSVPTALMIFSGVLVAFSGGFIMIWLYGQNWFMNFEVAGINLQDLFHIETLNLSVAVWVGFIALFGIATDDGVLMGTYLKEMFDKKKPKTVAEIRKVVLHAGSKRVRPAVMTTATTVIALIPILTSSGRGADIMIPMAIPSFGGMIIQMMTMFVVPVLYSMWKENSVISEQ